MCSFKIGGVALNLTCANRVILSDLWWNHALEQQAFGRVYRCGQTKETYFTRLALKGSTDEQMLETQQRKVFDIENAFSDGVGIHDRDGPELLYSASPQRGWHRHG